MLMQTVTDQRTLPVPSVWNTHWDRLELLSSNVSETVVHICHDLRHPLTAILANAEFLAQPGIHKMQSGEIYLEIRHAIEWMDDLISSLLEFCKGQRTLQLAPANIVDATRRAIRLALKTGDPSLSRLAKVRAHAFVR